MMGMQNKDGPLPVIYKCLVKGCTMTKRRPSDIKCHMKTVHKQEVTTQFVKLAHGRDIKPRILTWVSRNQVVLTITVLFKTPWHLQNKKSLYDQYDWYSVALFPYLYTLVRVQTFMQAMHGGFWVELCLVVNNLLTFYYSESFFLYIGHISTNSDSDEVTVPLQAENQRDWVVFHQMPEGRW